jgi:hypothetical protein
MQENCTSGSVRGALGNQRPYRGVRQAKLGVSCRVQVPARSPVRENRTPGSVRGALGNWRPYRDGIYVVLGHTRKKKYG